ncbi:MAG: DNA polymerase III subunit gamma/tau [Patescibacteria group bacterium]
MSQALYRKYRPQTFSEVIGQPHIKQTLLNQIKSHKIAHAYLFCGPRGIGKTTLARLIAKSANCLNTKQGEPCNECKNCRLISSRKTLDIIEIDAASNTGVDNVRDNIINSAHIATSNLPYKVFIIDEVHMLSLSAFNALLKTLEEPPKNVIFVLATTEIHKVPATIISRCQRYDFKKVPFKEITAKLEKMVVAENIKVDLDVLERVARQSEGSARDAESLLGQIIALDDNHITSELAELVLPRTETEAILEFYELLLAKRTHDAIILINKLIDDGVDLIEFNKTWLEFLRKILLFKISNNLSDLEYLDIEQSAHQKIINSIDKISLSGLQKIIEIFMAKALDLKSASILQLPLELAVVEICEAEPVATENHFSLPAKKKEFSSQPDQVSKSEINDLKQKPSSSAYNMSDIKTPPAFISTNNAVVVNTTANQEKCAVDQKTLDSIKQQMPEIIKALRLKNHSLALTLSIAQLVTYTTDNVLTIGVKYQFHSDRLCEPVNLQAIEEVLTNKLGRPVKVACLVDEQYEDKSILQNVNKSDNLDNVSQEEVGNVWDLAVNAFDVEQPKEN